MRTYTVNCYSSSGKPESTGWEMEYDFTDEEVERIKHASQSGAVSFFDNEEISDIGEKLYQDMLNDQIDIYLSSTDLKEYITDYLEENGEEIDEDYEITEDDVRNYLEDSYSFDIAIPEELLESDM